MAGRKCKRCNASRLVLDHDCIRHSCFSFSLGQWDPSECSDCIRNFALADGANSDVQMDARERICILLLRMVDSRSERNITRPLFVTLHIHSQWCRTWFGMAGSPSCFSKLVYRVTELLSLAVEPKPFINLTLPNPSFGTMEPLLENDSVKLSNHQTSLLVFKMMSESTSVRTTNCVDQNVDHPKEIRMTQTDQDPLRNYMTLPLLEYDSKAKCSLDPVISATKIQWSPKVVPAREPLFEKIAPEGAEDVGTSHATAHSAPVSNVCLKKEVETIKAESSERRASKSLPADSGFNTGHQLSLAEGNDIQPCLIIEESFSTTSPPEGTSHVKAEIVSPSSQRAPLQTMNTEKGIPVVTGSLSAGSASLKDLTFSVNKLSVTACSTSTEEEPVLDKNIIMPNQHKRCMTTEDTGKLSIAPLPVEDEMKPAETEKLTTSRASTMNKFIAEDNTVEAFPNTVAVQRTEVARNKPTIVVEKNDSSDSDSSTSNFNQESESPGNIRTVIRCDVDSNTTSQTHKASSDAKFSYPFGCTPLLPLSTAMCHAISCASTSSFYVVPESCKIHCGRMTIPQSRTTFSQYEVFLGHLNECRIAFFPLLDKRVYRIIRKWKKYDPTWMSSDQPSRSMVISYTTSFFNLLNANGLNLCRCQFATSYKDSGVFVVENLDEVIKKGSDAIVSSAFSQARHALTESLSWFTLKSLNAEDQSFLKYIQLPMRSVPDTSNEVFVPQNDSSYVAYQKIDIHARTRAAESVKVMQFLSIVETICAEMASLTFPQETREQVLSMLAHVTSFVRKSLSSALHSSLEEVVTSNKNLVSKTKVEFSEPHTSRQTFSSNHRTPKSVEFNDLVEDLPVGESPRMSAKRKRFNSSGGLYSDRVRNEGPSPAVPYGSLHHTDAWNMPSHNDPGPAFCEHYSCCNYEQSYSHQHCNWHSKKMRF